MADRTYALCYYCHVPGHYARNCQMRTTSTQTNNSSSDQMWNHLMHRSNNANDPYQNEQQPSFTQPAPGTENRNLEAMYRAYGGSTKSKKNYTEIKLYGKEVKAIIDSGCDISLFPASFVDERTTRKTKVELMAINQTPVDTVGEAVVQFQLDRRTVDITALVSHQATEVILGLHFLEKYNCACNFGSRVILVDGENYPLCDKIDFNRETGTFKAAPLVPRDIQKLDVPSPTVGNYYMNESSQRVTDRINGLCYYCHFPAHFARDCPLRPMRMTKRKSSSCVSQIMPSHAISEWTTVLRKT